MDPVDLGKRVSDEYLIAKAGVDRAANKPREIRPSGLESQPNGIKSQDRVHKLCEQLRRLCLYINSTTALAFSC